MGGSHVGMGERFYWSLGVSLARGRFNENHIDADIPLALKKLYWTTGDKVGFTYHLFSSLFIRFNY